MNDWLVVIVGGALASVLAALLHRFVLGPWSHRGEGRAASPSVPTSSTPAAGGVPHVPPSKSRVEDLAAQVERDKATLTEERHSESGEFMGCLATLLLPFLVIAPLASDSFRNGVVAFLVVAGFLLFFWGSYRLGTREVRRLKRRIKDLERALEEELGIPTARGRE